METPPVESTPQEAPEAAPQEAAPPPPDGETAPKELLKFKVKIDDEESEVDEKELIAGYQRAKASAKRFEDAKKEREAASAQKAEVDAMIAKFKSDPKSVLRDPKLGLNTRELAEQILMEEIEAEMMDPKERELRKLQTELDTIRQEKELEGKTKAERETAAKEAAEVEKWTQIYTTEFPKALTAVGLPLDQEHVERLKDVLIRDLEQGMDTDLEVLAREVKQSIENRYKSFLGSTPPELLFDMLGAEGYKKLSEYAATKYKKSVKPAVDAPKTEANIAKPLTKEERLQKMIAKLQES